MAVLTLLPSPATRADEPGSRLAGHVTRIINGDTIRVLLSNHEVTVTLHGIDAPDADQEFGPECTDALRKMLEGHNVELEVTGQGTDPDRITATVFRGDVNVNMAMVKQGFAWAARRYLRRNQDESLCAAEDLARKGLRGLWGPTMSEVAPWEWRRRRRIKEFTRYTNTTVADCVAEIGRE